VVASESFTGGNDRRPIRAAPCSVVGRAERPLRTRACGAAEPPTEYTWVAPGLPRRKGWQQAASALQHRLAASGRAHSSRWWFPAAIFQGPGPCSCPDIGELRRRQSLDGWRRGQQLAWRRVRSATPPPDPKRSPADVRPIDQQRFGPLAAGTTRAGRHAETVRQGRAITGAPGESCRQGPSSPHSRPHRGAPASWHWPHQQAERDRQVKAASLRSSAGARLRTGRGNRKPLLRRRSLPARGIPAGGIGSPTPEAPADPGAMSTSTVHRGFNRAGGLLQRAHRASQGGAQPVPSCLPQTGRHGFP